MGSRELVESCCLEPFEGGDLGVDDGPGRCEVGRPHRRVFLDYDRAHGIDPQDPRVDDLARRIVQATGDRYGSDELPGRDANSEIPAMVQAAVNASSPAWQRLDTLDPRPVARVTAAPTEAPPRHVNPQPIDRYRLLKAAAHIFGGRLQAASIDNRAPSRKANLQREWCRSGCVPCDGRPV